MFKRHGKYGSHLYKHPSIKQYIQSGRGNQFHNNPEHTGYGLGQQAVLVEPVFTLATS